MWTARTLAACAFGVVLSTSGLEAQDPLASQGTGAPAFAAYRNFTLKSDLATVSAATRIAASEVKTIHQRPALLQDLEWRPSRWISGSTTPSTDPVEQVLFSFYNDQLFRMVVDYGRERTEGMTDADMMEAIAAVYGAPIARVAGAAREASPAEAESGPALGRWGDAAHTVVLYRPSEYGHGFRLIVTESALAGLARKAALEGARLDQLDAPRVELERQKKARDDGRVVAEKARVVNKAAFRP
jgi:hypothetical protein